jgi:hypothetical protein
VQLILLWSCYDVLSCRPFLQPFKQRDRCRQTQCWPVRTPHLRRRRHVLAFYHLSLVLPIAACDVLHSQCFCSVHMATSDLTHSAITAISFSHNPLKMTCHYVYSMFCEGIHNIGSEEGTKQRLAFPLPPSPPHKGHATHNGWGTALQTERSRVWFPMVLVEFFIDVIVPAALWPWGVKAAGAKDWKPYHIHVPIVMNLGASTFWSPQGLLRAVQGLLYLYPTSPRNNAF